MKNWAKMGQCALRAGTFANRKFRQKKKPTKILALTFANYNFSSSFETKTFAKKLFCGCKNMGEMKMKI